MKIKDLKTKPPSELQKMLQKERANLRDLRFQVYSEQHKKVSDIKKTKRLIARILTLLNNKDLLQKDSRQTQVVGQENKK